MQRITLVLWALPILAQTPEQTELFEKQVRPVLAAKCQACHNVKNKTAGLDLESAAGFLAGGQSGPLVSPENPADSRLLHVISYDERLKMPPMGKLKAEEIAALTGWVKMGAPWPGAASAKVSAGPTVRKAATAITDADRRHWSFQPMKDPAEPAVRQVQWAKTDLDRFILAGLEARGLQPAAPASKTALLRRATFDLTGLPPTEREIRDFLSDASPQAFARVVDRLLASPRYGERWGRHWLDVARFADSTGNDEDHRYPYAWRYRDYVIESFNRDVPYDRFVREQIAGDLLPGAGGEVNRRGIVATGFLALGPKALAQQDKRKMLYDVYDEQVDVVSKAFLGLTLSCARCHDHKFDPLYQKDYYGMVGMFASTRSFRESELHVSKLLYTPLVAKSEYDRYRAYQDKLSAKQIEIEDVTDGQQAKFTEQVGPRLADYMLAAQRIRKGEKAADLAREKALREEVLAKWVKYLEPEGAPPHLEEWHHAVAGKQAVTAAAYQARFDRSLAEWTKEIDRWREEARRMLKEMNMPPRPRPKFEAEREPFFHSVYIDRGGPFAIAPKEQEKIFSAAALTQIAARKKELADLKSQAIPEPDMACAVEEGDPFQQRVFIRGDYASLGDDAPKRFPVILAKADDPVVSNGSGRAELAQWLTRPDHPLTARVMVNRIFQWHFGDGIVRTPDNWGRMGERPTHPELLDDLALRFVKGGWSVKSMHRMMMLSSAYQMSSEISGKAYEVDPENRLLSRFQRRRLAVEEIRDGMLALDGALDIAMGGTLQSGFGTDGENSNDRLSVNPEKIRRRMVYLPLRRSNLPTLLNLFDFGDAVTPSGKRTATNVAPQALFAMNSQFVAERAQNLAKSLLDLREPARRVETAYLRILNRMPAAAEVDAGLTYIDAFRKKFAVEESVAWQSLSRVLLGSNEFFYLD